jgi:hypothetical protein
MVANTSTKVYPLSKNCLPKPSSRTLKAFHQDFLFKVNTGVYKYSMKKDLLFPTQVFISISTIGFAMYMLAKGKDAGVYLPIITGITASWLPAPSQNKLQENAQPFLSNNNHEIMNDIEQPLLSHVTT